MAADTRRFSLIDRITRPLPRSVETQDKYGRYPRSESEWQGRYEHLRACYHLEPYDEGEIDGLHLFRAEDADGNDLARTRRILRDFSFVIDKDADHLFRGGLTLDTAQADDDTSDDLTALKDQGEAILTRSRLRSRLGMMAHDICLGRGGLEAQRVPRREGETTYRTRIVFHRPETYTVVTDDETGSEIESVTIRSTVFAADDYNDDGSLRPDAVLHSYVRRLTKDEVIVTLDGELVEEESGPHGLDEAVPFVNLVFKPTRETEHGVSAAHGLELAIAMLDSLYTQAHATGARFADPILAGKNVNLSGSSVGRFGRSLYWEQKPGVESEVGYIEPAMSGVTGILSAIEKLHSSARATMPEFGLFDASAAASGEALKTLQAAFVAKIEAARANVLPQIAEIIGIAVEMERDSAHDPDVTLFRVSTGPVLPTDAQGEMSIIMDAKDGGLISTADSIRHLQRLGLVPAHHDPEEYAIMVREESSNGGPVEFFSRGATEPGQRAEPDHAEDMADALDELRTALESEDDADALREAIREALGALEGGSGV